MSRPTPADLVSTLLPSPEDTLKREDRTVVWREVRPDGTRAVVKLYRKRGWLTTWRCRIFRFRTEREYRRLRYLERWGIPCTIPLEWARGSSPEHGRHEILVMREIPAAMQLGAYVRERLASGSPPDLAPLFRMVRRMHACGFCHQTLYAYNVLVDAKAPPGSEYFIADVPRSWAFPRSIVGTTMAYFDVCDLVAELEDAGMDPGAIPVEAYGSNAAAGRFLVGNRRRDPRSKGMRFLRDTHARMRWALAWAAIWQRRARPPPSGASAVEESLGTQAPSARA